jgi:hypothetical protein
MGMTQSLTPTATPVFFLSDNTGISAETMGNACSSSPPAAVRGTVRGDCRDNCVSGLIAREGWRS